MNARPAFDTPPDQTGAGGLRVWFTEPPGAVVQMSKASRGTREIAEWIVSTGVVSLRGRFPAAKSLIVVFDFTLMDGRDPEARAVLIDKARELNRVFSRTFIVLPAKASAVSLTTLHAAAALLSAVGVELVLTRSLEEVFRQCPLKPAGMFGAV